MESPAIWLEAFLISRKNMPLQLWKRESVCVEKMMQTITDILWAYHLLSDRGSKLKRLPGRLLLLGNVIFLLPLKSETNILFTLTACWAQYLAEHTSRSGLSSGGWLRHSYWNPYHQHFLVYDEQVLWKYSTKCCKLFLIPTKCCSNIPK